MPRRELYKSISLERMEEREEIIPRVKGEPGVGPSSASLQSLVFLLYDGEYRTHFRVGA